MEIQNYLRHARLRPLFAFLDLTVSARQRMVLLGLGAGFTERELQSLPGLSNPSRTRQAIRELEAAGRVRRTSSGWAAKPGRAPSDGDLAGCLRRWKKLREAFDLLSRPSAPLRARGLGRVADVLGPALSDALEAVLRTIDRRMPADQAARRRARQSVLSFVQRNLTPEYVSISGGGDGPPPAPHDVCERTIERLTAGLSGAEAAAVEREVDDLYRVLLGRGEAVLAHWWQILMALWDKGLRGQTLRREWRMRLESYLLRAQVRLSRRYRLRVDDPRKLKAQFPVPDCGYGPWVERELALYRAFRARYGPALGPSVKALWMQAHEAVPSLLLDDYPFATPDVVVAERYEEILFRVADALSGLSRGMLDDLSAGRRTRAIKACRAREEREAAARPLRLAVAKAAQAARDDRGRNRDDPDDEDEKDEKDEEHEENWAIRLLRLAAELKLENVGSGDFAKLVKESRHFGRGGRRVLKRSLSEEVLRAVAYELQKRPLMQGPGEPFSLSHVKRPAERALRRIENASRACAAERAAASEALERFFQRRGLVTVAYPHGWYEPMTVEAASDLAGRTDVRREVLDVVSEARARFAVESPGAAAQTGSCADS